EAAGEGREVREAASTFQLQPAPTAIDEPRLPRLVRDVLAVLEEISGHPMADVSPDSSLLDLGFDSLLLAQVATSIRDRFSVLVTFRQLMEQISTPALIAAHLDAEMQAGSEAKGEGQGAAAVSAVESLVQQQLELMRKQLELLGGASSASPLAETLRAQLGAPVQPAAKRQVAEPAETSASPARHGPFRPVERSKGDALTETQRQHLDNLIAAYCERTAASKRYAEEHRAEFCDPRSISGFHPLWKEMVYPIVCERSKGPRLWDSDGNEYLDITMGFGVNFFGHTPDFISRAITDQIERGYEIGPQTPLAGKVAQLLCELTGMERATVCNTGSEAVMAAMRVARTVTGRSRIVIFSDGYHGMFDSVLVRGVRRNGKPDTLPIAPGIPRGLIEDITVLDYGAEESLEWIRNHGREIAAVIVEPVQSRNPALQPREFLHRVRALTGEFETALVFDEVITGFRCHLGGAQAWYDVRADMATYGKVIGGGMPIGALAGSRKWMDALDGGRWSYGDDSIPEVGVTFFAGTFVRHPLAMAAAFAALSYLKAHGPELQEGVNRRAARLADELNGVFGEFDVAASVDHFASVFRVEISPEYKHAGLFFFHLRLRGIHFWEGRVGFISTTHTDADIDRIVAIFREAAAAMQAGGFLPERAQLEAQAKAPVVAHVPIAPPPPALSPVAHDVIEQAEGKLAPLTEEQHEIWLACQLNDATSTNFNMSAALHFTGAVDEAALQQAIQQVIDRHEALRSVFLEDGSAQLIRPAVSAQIETLHLPYEPAARETLLRAEASRPFDLARGPLVRFLFSVQSGGAVLVFTAHHSCCDGWSYDTILREMATYYSAQVRGSGRPVLEPAAQISTFAAEAPLRRVSPENVAAQAFWRKALENMPPPPDLPEDFARPQKARFNAGHEGCVIAPARVKAIKDFARANRATLFSTLFASYGALVHRLSGSDDMLIGVPVAGQHVHGVHSLVAHCVHFLPLRQRVDAAASFSEHARATSAMLFEAFEHSRVSFGELLRELNWRRDPSRPSPLGITFNLDPPAKEIEFEGLEMELKPTAGSTLNAELCFNVHEEADGSLNLECDYCSDLFSAETIRRWLEHFETLLDAAMREPACKVAELSIVPPEQRAMLLVTSNAGFTQDRGAKLLHELFEERAAAQVRAPAVTDARKSLTYGDLDARANQLARHLIDKGARSGECVALLFERSVDFVVAVLGVLKSGAAFVPLDAGWPEERKTAVIKNCRTRILVTAGLPPPAGTGHSLTIVDTLTDAAEIGAQSFSKPDAGIRPDQLAYVIFTSGSTGAPKGVMIEHRSIAAHIESIAQ
ncbi:MAG: aminotransferase class III-fold pyridoxal phosphate-dependent enzyme, partial [Opitutaceae bacterium]